MDQGEQTQARCTGDHEVFKERPFPFPGNRFPEDLGAVIQRTVSDGAEPAREIIHLDDNGWLVSDGVNDWNAPGAVQVACLTHLVDLDPSVEQMATLPLGHAAYRKDAASPWTVEPFAGLED
ncbi:hypothetical protein ACQP2E_00075 [Actinoplanes sp. CA-015351]|uniref:hypothetical protein n=1 Tax=Actinoplanes sp. CA-015351 TaxID=3239897 RepID=UPI003D961E49